MPIGIDLLLCFLSAKLSKRIDTCVHGIVGMCTLLHSLSHLHTQAHKQALVSEIRIDSPSAALLACLCKQVSKFV